MKIVATELLAPTFGHADQRRAADTIDTHGIAWYCGTGTSNSTLASTVRQLKPSLKLVYFEPYPDWERAFIDKIRLPTYMDWLIEHADLRFRLRRTMPYECLPLLPYGIGPAE